MKSRAIRNSFVIVAAVCAVVAAPGLSQAKVMNFMTVINGAQEAPPNASAAIGNGTLTYDKKTNTLCYYLSYVGGLAGGEILAHIHGPAAPGTNAGVLVALPLGTPKVACVNPSDPFSQKELKKNLYYVNIHSAGIPGGEIRGQIYLIK